MWGIYGYDGDYPCYWMPTPDAAKPGNCLIPVGKYYHSFLRQNDYSSWIKYYLPTAGPNDGWTHWVVREKVEAKFRKIDLYNYHVNKKIGPTVQQAVANVNLGEKRSMDKIHECPDGCQRAQSGIPLPGSEIPYVDCVYSTRLNKAYLYRREPSNTAYTLTGVDGDSQLVGDPGNKTAKFIGISSRNSKGDYVYTIGVELINTWLKEANAPFTISQLDDVAVSDQWWLTGGIVYALDKNQKKVYKFVRDEVTNKPSIPEQIIVYDGGVVPDSVNADGFGNLYLVRTKMEPEGAASTFKPADAKSYVKQVDYVGNVTYKAYFEQNVYKAAQKRDYYTKVFSDVPGKVLLGTNFYNRDFKTPTPENRGTWTWIGTPTQTGVTVQTAYRTELAVINSATPPQVGSATAITDVAGPMVSTPTGLQKGVPEPDGYFKDLQTYIFAVENGPYFDINGVNIGSTGKDEDGDGRIGEFPTTVKKATVKYYWKVVLTKDWSDNATTSALLDQEAANTPSTDSLLPVKLGAGEYRIGCKVVYQYYDYNKLPLGALSDAKETVLSTFQTGKGDGISYPYENDKNYSWADIKIKPAKPDEFPGGWGIIMSGLPTAIGYQYRPDRVYAFDKTTPQCNLNEEYPVGARFVVPEKTVDWSLRLRESDYNKFGTKVVAKLGKKIDRLDLMASQTPPLPDDPRMVTGTLDWMGSSKFTWTAELKRGTEVVAGGQIITETPELTLAQMRVLMPVPSQPRAYKIKVSGGRSYKYRTFFPNTRFIGGELITDYVETLMQKEIAILAECEIVITDETGPMLTFSDPIKGGTAKGFFISRDLLYATTGESLVDVEGAPLSNPLAIEFVVADNNPMGNDAASDDTTLRTYADPFHGSAVVGGIPNRCKVIHNVENRKATFHYETKALGLVPIYPGNSSTPHYTQYSSDPNQSNSRPAIYYVEQFDLTSTDFNKTWLPASAYNKGFAYRLYRLGIGKMEHFSDAAGGVKGAKMVQNYANSSPGYQNLRYGIEWREACLLATQPYNIGQIIIRDNDRPNLFVKAQELKNPDFEYFCPSNVKKSSMLTWTLLDTVNSPLFNGVENWNSKNILGFDSIHRVNGGSPVTNGLFTQNFIATFETDIPVFFTASPTDNVGVPKITRFQLTDGIGGTTDLPPNALNGSIRYLFRKAGNYKIEAEVEDTAIGWPADPYAAPTVANPKVNKRTVTCEFGVTATRLDVRVIDRSSLGK
jgi:hypothetical protein